MAISVVSFSFSRAVQPEARGAQLSAGCWLSLPHLVTNGSGLQTGLQINWLPVFTELNNSSIAHSISPHNWLSGCVTSTVLGMACLIVIERKQLSCSSQVTLFRCISLTVPWDFTLSHIVNQARLRQWNMQLPRLWNSMFGRVEGQYTTPRTALPFAAELIISFKGRFCILYYFRLLFPTGYNRRLGILH